MTWSEPERLKATLASMLDMHVLMEAVRDEHDAIVDFTILDGNDAFFEFVNRSPEEMLGTRLLDIVPGQRESGLLAAYAHTIDTGEPMRLDGVPYHDETKGGALRIYDLRGVKYHDALSITWRDVTDRVATIEALERSEQHYRLLAEHSSDVVYETDADGVIRWVSPSVERALGYAPDQMIGRNAFDLVDARYTPDPTTLRRRVFGGLPTDRHLQLFITADDGRRWMSVEARPVIAADGRVRSAVVSLHDCQDEVVAQRAHDTLGAVNDLLLRVPDESTLLTGICRLAVDRGGYQFAWYGRPSGGPDEPVMPVAASEDLRGYLDEVRAAWTRPPAGLGPARRALRSGATEVMPDLLNEPALAPWRGVADRRGFRSSVAIPVVVGGSLDGLWIVYAAELDAFTPTAVALLEDVAGQIGYGLGRLRDAAALTESVRDLTLVGTAIDQAAEAIVVTAPDGTILYVNPATTKSSGYEAAELIGATPRMFRSGFHDARFYRALAADLHAGRDWHGVIVNRRKDGDLYEEDVTIAPVMDESGEIIAFVAVKRDLSDQRRLEGELAQEQDDRAAMVRFMDEVRLLATVEATAQAFCDAACRIDDIDAATLMLVDPSGELVVAAVTNTVQQATMHVGEPAPVVSRDWLADLTLQRVRFADFSGVVDPEAGAHRDLRATARNDGLLAGAAVAIQWEGRMLGVLSLGTATTDGRDRLRNRTALVDEVATFASTLFGRAVAERLDADSARNDLRTILAGRRFHPEYQPIVELADGTLCGYEALARFDDGTRPDLEFARARRLGLGSELEAACAQAAIDGAARLPSDVWLSVNFSPDAVLDGTAATVVGATARPMVIEITEHTAIESYEDLRIAVAGCGGARLSVDDAGAGFASLRHILELAPAIVKLDFGLVHDIDRDPARQALAAGLVHFAIQTGITLIAEGVETEAEAQTLRVLGVRLGQGYLFGRPALLS